jgi:hypothetical protein
MYREPAFGELAAAPVLREAEQVNCLDFDLAQEVLWAGTDGGYVVELISPTLERRSAFPAHRQPVVDLISLGHSALSISSSQLCLQNSGGAPTFTHVDEVRVASPDS